MSAGINRTFFAGDVLEPDHSPIESIHFVTGGCVSVLLVDSGVPTHVGLVGNEGAVGVARVHGVESSPLRSVAIVPTTTIEFPADYLLKQMRQHADVERALLVYAHSLGIQIAANAAANGRLAMAERIARAVAMLANRLGQNISITHEALAKMLSVRRAGVTVELGRLEEAGIVKVRRSMIEVLDADRLQEMAAEFITLNDEAAPARSSAGY